MILVYCSSSFRTMTNFVEECIDQLKKDKYIRNNFHFLIPKEIKDPQTTALVYSDLERLKQSHMVITHIALPSVGACMEIAYFKALKPECPIIGYKCLNHPWLNTFLDFKTDNVESIKQFLIEYSMGLTYGEA